MFKTDEKVSIQGLENSVVGKKCFVSGYTDKMDYWLETYGYEDNPSVSWDEFFEHFKWSKVLLCYYDPRVDSEERCGTDTFWCSEEEML